jgi:predicted TIM-barrel fold metal-dependent hydrolase
VDGDRIRPVAVLLSESVEQMVTDGETAIDAGLRGLWIPTGVPPASSSPADPALDRFWALAEQSNTPVLFHVGTEFAFASPAWYANVKQFEYGPRSSIEFPIEPYRASTINLANEAFLGAMVLGGVFERFPELRVGVVECGAHWVGPLAEKLDLWSSQFGSRLESLSMLPSAYLSRNVRVTPFFFEPVGMYFKRYPQLSDVYCFGSDFPHVEGGKRSKQGFMDRLRPLGEDVVDRFFVRNGELILPA